MALNSTQRERSKQADREFKLKNRLEVPVRQAMKRIFNNMNSAFEQAYKSTGTIISLEPFEKDVRTVLEGSYEATGKAFGTQISDHIADNEGDADELLVALMMLAAPMNGNTPEEQADAFRQRNQIQYGAFTENRINNVSGGIINTKQKELGRSVQLAQIEVSEMDTPPANSINSIAAIAATNFAVRFPADSARIAATEVQTGAESAKRIESASFEYTVSGLATAGLALVDYEKEWHTRGDKEVRPAHRAVDFEKIDAADLFTVGGERLAYPADSTHGATAGNVINCRCSAIYFVQGIVTGVVTA